MDASSSIAYRRNALQCFDLARLTTDPEAKQVLMHMAQAWMTLSDQAKKASATAPHEVSQPTC